MDFKQVFLYDGTPYLAYKSEDGEYDYPEESWTEVAPPEGIYSPFYFNGNEWIGATREEYEATLPEKEPIEPKVLEMMVSQLQLQVMIGNKKTKELEDKLKVSEQTLADAVLKITELENKIGGNA